MELSISLKSYFMARCGLFHKYRFIILAAKSSGGNSVNGFDIIVGISNGRGSIM